MRIKVWISDRERLQNPGRFKHMKVLVVKATHCVRLIECKKFKRPLGWASKLQYGAPTLRDVELFRNMLQNRVRVSLDPPKHL